MVNIGEIAEHDFFNPVVDFKLSWDVILPIILIYSNTCYVCFMKYDWIESEVSLLIAKPNKPQLL